jgi:hypothetical protein
VSGFEYHIAGKDITIEDKPIQPERVDDSQQVSQQIDKLRIWADAARGIAGATSIVSNYTKALRHGLDEGCGSLHVADDVVLKQARRHQEGLTFARDRIRDPVAIAGSDVLESRRIHRGRNSSRKWLRNRRISHSFREP